jgi:acetamidase/formamidase
MLWQLDPEQGTATSPAGVRLHTRPFVGYVGTTPNEPGIISTFPPHLWRQHGLQGAG